VAVRRSLADTPFIRGVSLLRADVPSFERYPYSIPAVRHLDELPLDYVTIFVGENATGKSTLVEAIAVAAGFNPEGGSRNFSFATHPTHSGLVQALRLIRGVRRPRTGYFLRAESYYNVATEIARLDEIPDAGPLISPAYGGDPHTRSHGESFLALAVHRFGKQGLYVLDEPEAALSPAGCIRLLLRMRQLVAEGGQFIYATHSPLLMAYPGATIYLIDDAGPRKVAFDELEHVRLMRDFLAAPERFVQALLEEPPE